MFRAATRRRHRSLRAARESLGFVEAAHTLHVMRVSSTNQSLRLASWLYQRITYCVASWDLTFLPLRPWFAQSRGVLTRTFFIMTPFYVKLDWKLPRRLAAWSSTENLSNAAVKRMTSEHSAAWVSDTIIAVAAATSKKRERQSLRRLLTFSLGFCNVASSTSDDQYFADFASLHGQLHHGTVARH